MKGYIYIDPDDDQNIIQIIAAYRPSPSTRPKNGAWVVQELKDGKWTLPSFPEITWGTLSKLTYLGTKWKV